MIDEGGLGHLTTRRLAERLGVKGPSIYNHFPTMDAVTDAVVDSLLEKVDTSILHRVGWREALPLWARDYWNVLHEHPAIVPLLARGPSTRRAQLRLADAFFGSLIRGGWPAKVATEVAIAVRDFISGSALGSYSGGFSQPADFYTDDYPNLTEAHRLPERQAKLDVASFERGLSCIMDGLMLQYASEALGMVDRTSAAESVKGK